MPTPDAPVPGPKKTVEPIPFAAPAAAPVPTAPARPKGAAPDPDPDNSEDESPAILPKNTSPWTIAFGVLSVALVILVLVLWGKVGARDQTIEGNKNRAAQVEARGVVLQAELAEASVNTDRLLKQIAGNEAESLQLKADIEKLKADSAELQVQLDKARVTSAGFQTQMEEAKVASIKRQGEVENAKAQTAVMQTQLGKSKADMAQVQARLDEATLQANDLRTRLARAEAEIAQLKKPARRQSPAPVSDLPATSARGGGDACGYCPLSEVALGMPEQRLLELEKQLVAANEAVTNLTAANALLTTQLADAENRNKKLRRSSRSGESALRAELAVAQNRRF